MSTRSVPSTPPSDDFFEEDEPIEDVIAAFERATKIWVDFNDIDGRGDERHLTTLLKFAAVARNVTPGNVLTATDADGLQAKVKVVSVSEKGLVDLLLLDWEPTRGVGWCAPSP